MLNAVSTLVGYCTYWVKIPQATLDPEKYLRCDGLKFLSRQAHLLLALQAALVCTLGGPPV